MKYSFYSLDSFWQIMETEERKGALKENYYSSETQKKSKDLKKLRHSLNSKRGEEKAELEREIANKKKEYEQAKEKELKSCCENIVKENFSFELEEKEVKGKPVYCTRNLESVLVSKALMLELKDCFNIEFSNRNDIVEELKALLNDPLPKILIRMDVWHFFESIDQSLLMRKVDDSFDISRMGARYLRKFFYSYNSLTKSVDKKGIPRGLCFSSVLSEIYMKEFDKSVLDIEGVYFYKRYVDDIIIMARPGIMKESQYVETIERFASKLKLSFNRESSKFYHKLLKPDNGDADEFDYLGYRFKYHGGSLSILLSDNKKQRYRLLIDKIFEIYQKTCRFCARKSGEVAGKRRRDATVQFMHRLNALTGNGKLDGRKKQICTGIYYSNKFLTDLSQLNELDDYMKSCLDDPAKFKPANTLFNYGGTNDYSVNVSRIKKKIIDEYSFSRGFAERRMYRWRDYHIIMKQLNSIFSSCKKDE